MLQQKSAEVLLGVRFILVTIIVIIALIFYKYCFYGNRAGKRLGEGIATHLPEMINLFPFHLFKHVMSHLLFCILLLLLDLN